MSTAPIAAAVTFPTINEALAWLASVSPETAAVYDRWRAKLAAVKADGRVSLGEIAGLIHDAQTEIMDDLTALKADGGLKKEVVLHIVGALFDAIPVLPLPIYLVPFRPWLKAWARAQVLAAASAIVETIYHRFLQ
jgi:hypothetical protein